MFPKIMLIWSLHYSNQHKVGAILLLFTKSSKMSGNGHSSALNNKNQLIFYCFGHGFLVKQLLDFFS